MIAPGLAVLRRPSPSNPRHGHPWIFRGQVASVKDAEPGGLVRAVTEKGHPIGTGYYNPRSEIAIRLLTRDASAIDAAFFRERLSRAEAFRRRHVKGTNAWRVVASEADGLPGLIVDRYDEVLVVQFLTLGMERLRDVVLEAMGESLPARGVFERSDSSSRKLEGLEARAGWLRRDCGDAVTVHEGGVRYALRFEAGHKTGMYLDQRENRLEIASYAEPGARALDAFCYEGGFGLHLARAGMDVLALDQSDEALRQAERNRELSGIPPERFATRRCNAFDELKSLEKAGRRFDVVVLDPPSFVKHKAALEGALAGYKDLALRAMRMLNDGGRLAVFSCSYHVSDDLLMRACLSAAHDVRRGLRVLRFFKQSADHPIDPFVPETYYLKGFLFELHPA